MNFRSTKLLATLALFASLATTPAASAGSTFLFNANQNYTGASSGLLLGSGGTLIMENFEHGSINSLLTATGGSIKGPSATTDSVDADDGGLNGSGTGGHSYASNGKSMTFKFKALNGSRPTMAGLAWTDGRPNALVTLRAWDAQGNLLGKISARLGDLLRKGSTGEDRFFGIMSDEGISRMRINSSKAGFEVDHVQFAYGFSVVPVPPALGMGLAGLASLGLWQGMRRRTNRAKA